MVEEGGVEAEEQRHEKEHAAVGEQGDGGGLLHVGDAVLVRVRGRGREQAYVI